LAFARLLAVRIDIGDEDLDAGSALEVRRPCNVGRKGAPSGFAAGSCGRP
jgi:hypothetical protein